MTNWFSSLVFLLCFLTSATCAVLLARSYARTGLRLLMWSALCFALLAGNNLVVFADMLIVTAYDLRLLRHAFAVSAVFVLLFGFIWEIEE